MDKGVREWIPRNLFQGFFIDMTKRKDRAEKKGAMVALFLEKGCNFDTKGCKMSTEKGAMVAPHTEVDNEVDNRRLER